MNFVDFQGESSIINKKPILHPDNKFRISKQHHSFFMIITFISTIIIRMNFVDFQGESSIINKKPSII